MKFGRIKKYFFLEIIVKHTDVSVFLAFVFGAFVQQLCVLQTSLYEEVKNTSNVLGPSAVTSKWV